MFIIKILRYLKGIIYFEASGGFPERFLNLCSKLNIKLNDVQIHNGTLFSSTDLKGYKKIRTAARKSGMKVRISKKSGLPFILFKNRLRAGLLFGAAAFFLLMAFLSSFIWTVEVSGCDRICEAEILKTAEKLNLKAGVKKKSINIEETEDKIFNTYKDILFVAVNLKGSNAEIKIMEKPPVEPSDDDPTPCDIVAAKDGQIVTLENFCGTKLLKEKDVVLKGDVIISSVVENRNGTNTFKRAKGYVTAKTNLNLSQKSSFDEKFYRVYKTKRYKELKFFHIKVPLYREAPKGLIFDSSKMLYLNDKILPIGINEKRNYIINENNLKITDKKLQTIALERFCNNLQQELKHKKVLSYSLKLNKNRLCNEFIANLVLLENIGVKKALNFEKN